MELWIEHIVQESSKGHPFRVDQASFDRALAGLKEDGMPYVVQVEGNKKILQAVGTREEKDEKN